MKDKLVSLAKRGWILPVIGAVVLSLAAGAVLAAMAITHNGSVTVQAPQPPTTYLFEVYDSFVAGNVIPNSDSTYFALGPVSPSAVVSKTVYVGATGTGSVQVSTAVTGTVPGTFTVDPATVTVNPGGARQAVTVTFTAGATPGSGNFAVTYTGSP